MRFSQNFRIRSILNLGFHLTGCHFQKHLFPPNKRILLNGSNGFDEIEALERKLALFLVKTFQSLAFPEIRINDFYQDQLKIKSDKLPFQQKFVFFPSSFFHPSITQA